MASPRASTILTAFMVMFAINALLFSTAALAQTCGVAYCAICVENSNTLCEKCDNNKAPVNNTCEENTVDGAAMSGSVLMVVLSAIVAVAAATF